MASTFDNSFRTGDSGSLRAVQSNQSQHRSSVQPDRLAIMLGGAALAAWGVTRGTLPGLIAGALGGYAAYCAAGVCHPPMGDVNRTFGGPRQHHPEQEDPIDEASLESFPASDSPSYSSSRG
jgi:hypothetical protein